MKGSFLNIALIVRCLVALAKLGELLLVGVFGNGIRAGFASSVDLEVKDHSIPGGTGPKKWTRFVALRRAGLIVIRESNTKIHNREVFCPCSMAGPAFPAKRSVLSEISSSCLL